MFALVMAVATAYDVIAIQWFGGSAKHDGKEYEVMFNIEKIVPPPSP